MLLDTNALFLPVRSGFPLEAEIGRIVPGARIVVPASALRELDRLEARGTPQAAGARAFAARFEVVPARAEGDAGVLEATRREDATLVTADVELQGTARSVGISVLVPRDRHRLELHRDRPARQ